MSRLQSRLTPKVSDVGLNLNNNNNIVHGTEEQQVKQEQSGRRRRGMSETCPMSERSAVSAASRNNSTVCGTITCHRVYNRFCQIAMPRSESQIVNRDLCAKIWRFEKVA